MPHAIFITGQQIIAFDASRPENKITAGWLQVTPEQCAAAQGPL